MKVYYSLFKKKKKKTIIDLFGCTWTNLCVVWI